MCSACGGGMVPGMPISHEHATTSATGLREQLALLERERATARLALGLGGVALAAGMAADAVYMVDLLDELEAVRTAYVGAAVTEIGLSFEPEPRSEETGTLDAVRVAEAFTRPARTSARAVAPRPADGGAGSIEALSSPETNHAPRTEI